MTTLWKNPSTGKLLKLPGGDLMGDDTGCCCEFDCSSCTCASQGPEASFYFEQTNDDPCTFNFYDDSSAGDAACGGTILSWEWAVGASVFSTAQNPTGIDLETAYGTGPWDVTLTITTECCEDSVVMEIRCFAPPATACCSDDPVGMLVTISGVTEKAGVTCAMCDAINGTYYLYACQDFGTCSSVYSCDGGTRTYTVQGSIFAGTPRPWAYVVEGSSICSGLADYRWFGSATTSTGTPCKGFYTLTGTGTTFGTTKCDYPATVTMIVF